MRLYLVTYDCSDYYCDGDHPVGVFSTEERARAAEQEHRELSIKAYPSDARARWVGQWTYAVSPWTLDHVEGPES